MVVRHSLGIRALVVGLMIHALVVACMPMVWCLNTGTVHSVQRLDVVANAGPAAFDAAAATTELRTPQLASLRFPGKTECFSHHRLVDSAVPASDEVNGWPDIWLAMDQPDWWSMYSRAAIAIPLAADTLNHYPQLEHIRTIVLLI